MQQIIKALDVERNPVNGVADAHASANEAAARWAEFALKYFVGKRLRKALAISRSLVEFTALDEESRP